MSAGGRNSPLLTVTAAGVVVAALYLAREVLLPFALAVVLAFLLGPLVARLRRWHLPRALAVALSLVMVCSATGLVGWFVVGQIRELAVVLPEYGDSIRSKIERAQQVLEPSVNASRTMADLGAELTPAAPQGDPADEATAVRVVEPAPDALDVLVAWLSPTLGLLFTTGMVLVFAFVMLLRPGDLRDRFIRLAGDGQIPVTTHALNETTQRVSSYLARLLLLNMIYGTAIALGLWALGVPSALLWGALAGLLRFIPYLGPWISAAFPVLTALATAPGWTQPLLVIGLIVALELISNLVLEPWVYGKGTGISPLALLLSMLFWTWLWGPAGLVLSTPFTVCLVVMGKHVPQLHFLYLAFSNAPGLPAPARLYQRLLVGEQDQAWDIVAPELQSRPLPEVYDAIVLPALAMSERDRARGAVDTEAQQRLERSLGLLLDEAGELNPAADEPAPDPLRVLIVPGEDAADALASEMAAQVLQREGLLVTVVPPGELSGETLERLPGRDVQVVCLSAISPARYRHVRYLCKRIAATHPGLPIVVGLWGVQPDDPGLAARVPQLEQVQVVTSLEAARTLVRQLAETVRARQQAGLAAGVAQRRPRSLSSSRAASSR